MNVEMLKPEHINGYLTYMRKADAQSGVDGLPHFHPYGKDEPYDMQAAIQREHKRWTTPLDEPGWRRAWGIFDSDQAQPVGHLYFEGGMLLSAMHRVGMGMGLLRSHHRLGGGTMLLTAAIDWARNQPGIDWIDLGVFEENIGAHALYKRFGFVEQGRTPDLFRVDGHQIDDISMSLFVG